MHDQLVLLVVGGLIGGGFTLAAQLINSVVAYKTATDRRKAEWLRRHLIQANEDIAALYGLEKRYVAELAKLDPSRTAESWRLGIRKEQREEDHLSPSSKATDTYATAQAHELRDLHIP